MPWTFKKGVSVILAHSFLLAASCRPHKKRGPRGFLWGLPGALSSLKPLALADRETVPSTSESSLQILLRNSPEDVLVARTVAAALREGKTPWREGSEGIGVLTHKAPREPRAWTCIAMAQPGGSNACTEKTPPGTSQHHFRPGGALINFDADDGTTDFTGLGGQQGCARPQRSEKLLNTRTLHIRRTF